MHHVRLQWVVHPAQAELFGRLRLRLSSLEGLWLLGQVLVAVSECLIEWLIEWLSAYIMDPNLVIFIASP